MGIKGIVKPALLALLADGKPRTAREIAAAVDSNHKYIRDTFNDMVLAQEAHIVGYDNRRSMIYALGAGVNVDPPPFKTSLEQRVRQRELNRSEGLKKRGRVHASSRRRALSDQEIDARYRIAADWWPWADSVVCNSISAMCRTARVAA